MTNIDPTGMYEYTYTGTGGSGDYWANQSYYNNPQNSGGGSGNTTIPTPTPSPTNTQTNSATTTPKPIDPTPKDPTPTPVTLDQAKIDYTTAANALETARINKSTNPDGYTKALNDFNKALDNLISASGYDTKKYNHKTVTFVNSHVNAKADIIIKTVAVGKELDAASMVITDGLRTPAEFKKIYPKKGPNAYKDNQHCQGNAIDVTFFKSDGTAINKFTAAKAAATIPGINGIGTYNNLSIVHIDMRDTTVYKAANWYTNNTGKNGAVEHDDINYATDPNPQQTVKNKGW